ncbi:MAG: hypothetical protein JWP91_868 [Fibrobacteres bacterium]|nr:hypothetical protein [Fibrobacterota bacterium]
MKTLLSVSALCLVSCAPNYMMYTQEKFPPLGIPATVGSVRILDTRQGWKDIQVGFMHPDSPVEFKSRIDSLDSAAILEQVERNTGAGSGLVTLVLRIQEAEIGYGSSFMRASETGKAKISIEVLSAAAKIAECSGKAQLEKRSGKATVASMKKVFRETLILSTYQCLESLQDEIKKGTIRIPAGPGRLGI